MSPSLANPTDILSTFRWLNHPEIGVIEVRAIGPSGMPPQIGYFDDPWAFVRECTRANATANVYAGVQPRPRELFAQAPNTIRALSHGGRDADIQFVIGTVIDIDPFRPRDTASTDAEVAEALYVANQAAGWLEFEGFLRPGIAMSGNGGHLWLAVDPIGLDGASRPIVTANMKHLELMIRERFGTKTVKVDSIFNLGRIIKVIGTVSRKGVDTPERPQRTSAPVGPWTRTPCPALRAWLLHPRPVTDGAAGTTGTSRRRLPLHPGALPAPSAVPADPTRDPLAPTSPVSLCSPMQRLWDEGNPGDRSHALFGVTRMLAHRDLPLEQIVDLVQGFDLRTGAKLAARDAAAFIRHGLEKIEESRGTDGIIAPPCGLVQQYGFCRVNREVGVVCELHDRVLDIEGAIDAIPDEATETERNYRLLPIFEAIVRHGLSEADQHELHLRDRFGLDQEVFRRALEAAKARVARRLAEQKAAPRDQGAGAPPPHAERAAPPNVVLPRVAMDGEIVEEGGHYIAPSATAVRVISSFVLRPTRRVTTEDGEIIFADATTDVGTGVPGIQLPRSAFNSKRDLLARLHSADLQWTGDDKHVQGLLRLLAAAPGVPRQQGTTTLGYFTAAEGPLWIFPGGAISAGGFVDPPPVIYVSSGSSLDARVRFVPTDDATFSAIARAVFENLPHVNLPGVIVPLIAWFFATPVKPWVMERVGSFPVASVTGTGGTGKTSLLCDVFMPLFGMPEGEPNSVTGTEFALLRQLAATSSIPLILDEYKPQDMPQHRLDQTHRYLRRVYKGEVEERGNADRSVSSYRLTAPVCLSGESRPNDAALMERFITASPAKGTLEASARYRDAFARLRAIPLHYVAPRYIQFCLGRDLGADFTAATERTNTLLEGRTLPLRVVDNLRVMAFGVRLFESFGAASGVPLSEPLDLAAAIDAVISDVTDGRGQPQNALDRFIEMLGVMSVQGELPAGVHVVRDGTLYLHLPSAYDAFRRHHRRANYREDAIDLNALRRLARENHRQGGYVSTDPADDNRVYLTPGKRLRAVAIDLFKAGHLLNGAFDSTSGDTGRWERMGES